MVTKNRLAVNSLGQTISLGGSAQSGSADQLTVFGKHVDTQS